MHHVGQDEIVILLEKDSSNQLPKDIFLHLNEIFRDADKGKNELNSLPISETYISCFFLFCRTNNN